MMAPDPLSTEYTFCASGVIAMPSEPRPAAKGDPGTVVSAPSRVTLTELIPGEANPPTRR